MIRGEIRLRHHRADRQSEESTTGSDRIQILVSLDTGRVGHGGLINGRMWMMSFDIIDGRRTIVQLYRLVRCGACFVLRCLLTQPEVEIVR